MLAVSLCAFAQDEKPIEPVEQPKDPVVEAPVAPVAPVALTLDKTFTNGLAVVRKQIPDALYMQLLTLKRITGDTNGMNVCATNWLRLTLTPEASAIFEENKRKRAMQILSLPGDDDGLKLKRIGAILDEP